MFSLRLLSPCFVSSISKTVLSRTISHNQQQKSSYIQPSVLEKHQIIDENLIKQFHDDGFLIVNDLLSSTEKKKVIDYADGILALPETAGKWMQYYEIKDGKKLLCRTENFLDYFPELNELLRGKITDAISQLLGTPAILFKEKINFKLPGGAGFGAHQDAPAYTTFHQDHHLTVMIAIDKSDTQNGCLEVVRGEHKSGMLPHPNGVMEKWLVEKWENEHKWEPVELEAGSLLFFGSMLPHRSGQNVSNRPRRAYYLTYNALSDGDFRKAYYADKREKFPPAIERVPGKDYSEGARVYNLANPIPT
ncbi:unnamed protein product [Adineta steineri]|uniref:Phytanoyl-CoA dioxygenase n=1 Tax=Adineta steineri TaxID=433720 RepID=A0A819G4T6_9BILA|nr:unnamed protein product [Adineta steineri]